MACMGADGRAELGRAGGRGRSGRGRGRSETSQGTQNGTTTGVSSGLGQRVGWVSCAGDQKEGWKSRERYGTGGRCVQKIVHRNGVGLGKTAK